MLFDLDLALTLKVKVKLSAKLVTHVPQVRREMKIASCYDTELTVMVQGSGTKWDLLTGSESVNAWTNCDAPRI